MCIYLYLYFLGYKDFNKMLILYLVLSLLISRTRIVKYNIIIRKDNANYHYFTVISVLCIITVVYFTMVCNPVVICIFSNLVY